MTVSLGSACKIVVLGGSKGGLGRSSCARNLLVSAAQRDIKAVGIDLDKQGTFARWRDRRVKTQLKLHQIAVPEVFPGDVTDLNGILRRIDGYQLAIIDTAPGIEENMPSMINLCRRADLVLVPTGPTHDDLESVAPWVVTLSKSEAKAKFLLNKVNLRTKSLLSARSQLNRYGFVIPLEIPLLEDIHLPHAQGLAAVDYEKGKAGDVMRELWAIVRREIGL